MSGKKVLKNKEKVFTKGISALLISSGILSAVGLGGFIHFNREYIDLQEEIDNNVAKITSTEEYIAYKTEQEKYFYEMYKNGEISSEEFDESLANISASKHIIENDVPVDNEQKQELAELEKEKLEQSFGALGGIVTFVGFGAVAFSGTSAMLDKKDEEQREM